MNLLETLRPGRGVINAATEVFPDFAAESGVERACALLGIPAVAPASPAAPVVTAVIFQDAEEYVREVFGEREVGEQTKIVQPRPIVHLSVAPQPTPPRAA